MALKFEGFSATDLNVARAILMDARDVLDKAQKGVRDGDAKANTAISTWFGPLSATQLTELGNGMHGMYRAWSRPSFKIAYATNGAAGENARVQHFKKFQGNVQGNTFAEAQAGVVHAMTLFPPMFTGKTRAKKNEQSQIQVILHELSHYGAGTEDITYVNAGTSYTCYQVAGATQAKTLGRAFDNAENWGFFLMEFYNLITPH